MKKLTITAVLGVALALPFPVLAEPTVKEVCRVQKDKDGKEKKVCKKIKVHKKLDGKKVPTK